MEVSSNLYLAVYGTFLSLLLGYGSLGCLEEEKVGLFKLKAPINHPNGTSLSSWGAEVGDCCRWENVTCDNKTSRVIQLFPIRDFELGEWSLNASLLLPFQQLQVLHLARNELTGWWLSLVTMVFKIYYHFIFHKLVWLAFGFIEWKSS